MYLKLEDLSYQNDAINSVVSVFEGQLRNTFDNANDEGIRLNYLSLSQQELESNLKAVLNKNGITDETAQLSTNNDICIEMETGTGKTLVYIKTVYNLFKKYGFTKFIIIVPSIAIKEGVLSTLKTFERQLEGIYNIKLHYFEYNSKQLSKVISFISDQHPQIMIMTLQSFNSEDRILNQAQREDLFSQIPYIEAIAKTRPIIIMDEPQEGMDTPNSISRLKTINPLFKLRYSATHKEIKNLVYRLTPFDSYKQGLVKKIEVLTVSEKNDEAGMKIELSKIEFGKGEPQAVLKLWHSIASGGFKFKITKKLDSGSKLAEITNNMIYNDYIIEQIAKPIRDKGFVKFKNGVIIYEGEQAKDYSTIFGEQLHRLIDTHIRKKITLKKHGIKCLSLIFIDRVDNYMQTDGIIRKAFIEQYKKFFHDNELPIPSQDQIEKVQGYYFAKTGKGDYTDSVRTMETNKELFDLILRDKERLLSFDNPVEFIFSHSALGVGWDNPNIFNIATLNQSYSEIKKRQEIGRGLRICVNQDGLRIYDDTTTLEGKEINLLTVIPNETYETFVTQYQSEIKDIYGTIDAGAQTRNNHKGNLITNKIKRNDRLFNDPSFKEFWSRLSKKTDYKVFFDEDKIISDSINALNAITISESKMLITIGRIKTISDQNFDVASKGTETKSLKTMYSKVDLVEELSENTALAYPTVFKIIKGLTNLNEIVKNPPLFLMEAQKKIKQIELDEMLRAVEYSLIDEKFDIDEFKPYFDTSSENIQPTTNRGIYDYIVYDSNIEKDFAEVADIDNEVVCFLKLPKFYKIKTPIGDYNPDFGVVLRKNKIRDKGESEYYFVIETKGTDDINDHKALKLNEINKIKCAIKHFKALGIDAGVKYVAPIKEYKTFKDIIEGS